MVHPKIALSFVALLPSLMLGAQTEPSARSPSAQVVKTQSSVGEADKLLASWLMSGCKSEVAIARIAVRKAQNADVRQFAQKMVDEHAQVVAKLLPFAGTETRVGSGARTTKDSDDAATGEREPAEASNGRVPVAKGEFDHIALIRDLGKQCLESQVRMLESKTGAEFDRSFMQAQVGSHDRAVIMVEVFSNYASADLRPTLQLAGTALRAHLEQATALCKKCDDTAMVGKQKNDQK